MKQSIPTPVVVGIIVVVVAIAGFFGYRTMVGGKSKGPSQQEISERIKQDPNAYKAGMMGQGQMQRNTGSMMSGGMSGGMMSGGR